MKYNVSPRKGFLAWQPSTWPNPPSSYNKAFEDILKIIFYDSMLNEIENVIKDAPTLKHRGHVISLSILCGIDTLSSYAFRDLRRAMCSSCRRTDRVGPRYKKYIETFFPQEYKPFSDRIYHAYRNSITHSWHLFEATMLPGSESITEKNGTIILGLRHFFDAFRTSVNNFLGQLPIDNNLQTAALHRYNELKQTARP